MKLSKRNVLFIALLFICLMILLKIGIGLIPKKSLAYQTLSYNQMPVFNGPAIINKPQVKLVNSQKDLDRILGDFSLYSPAEDLSPVDFLNQSLIFLSAGNRPTGGNYLQIKSVTSAAGKTHLDALLTIPDKNCLATSYFTSPVAAIVVSKTDDQINFTLKEEKKDCPKNQQNHAPLPL